MTGMTTEPDQPRPAETETQVQAPAPTETRPVGFPKAQVGFPTRTSAFAGTQGSAFARAGTSAFAATRPAPGSPGHTQSVIDVLKGWKGQPSAFTVNRRRAPARAMPRRIVRRILLVPSNHGLPPSGLWWMNYRDWLYADREATADEYAEQIHVDHWVDFDQADRAWKAYLEKCNNENGSDGRVTQVRAACVAEIVPERVVESVLTDDPNMLETLAPDDWNLLVPDMLAFRDKMAVDLEWLIDIGVGKMILRAMEWATELGDIFHYTGQKLRARAKALLDDPRFCSALLDVMVFEHALLIDEGAQLFADISRLVAENGYFPCAPQQVLVFESFGGRDEHLDEGRMGMRGAYQVARTEYYSNLDVFRSEPKFGAVGWRVHYMRPSSKG